MAGLIQLGDVIQLGRLAWDVYEMGWKDDMRACEYYLVEDSPCDRQELGRIRAEGPSKRPTTSKIDSVSCSKTV